MTCADVDECAADESPCDANASCTNSDGSYACECNAGWTGDGATCEKIDYCNVDPAPCSPNATCTSGDLEATCECQSGWSGDGVTCTDINECEQYANLLYQTFDVQADADTWVVSAKGDMTLLTEKGLMNASSTIDTHVAASPAVFNIPAGTKISFDLIVQDPGSLFVVEWRTCADPSGSVACDEAVTSRDYEAESLKDYSLLECASLGECAIPNAELNAYTFVLPQGTPGFLVLYSSQATADVIWSLDNLRVYHATTPCNVDATCTNTDGGYECACNQGWEGDGFGCTEIDECATGTHSCDANASCSNTVGDYTCTCNGGWEGDGKNCTDVNECGFKNSPCKGNQTCTNTDGSYTCGCAEGYEPKPTEFPVNGCVTNADCDYQDFVCFDTLLDGKLEALNDEDQCDPASACSCLPKDECVDIDECADSPCGQSGVCNNTPGSYTCGCPEGTELTEDGTCGCVAGDCGCVAGDVESQDCDLTADTVGTQARICLDNGEWESWSSCAPLCEKSEDIHRLLHFITSNELTVKCETTPFADSVRRKIEYNSPNVCAKGLECKASLCLASSFCIPGFGNFCGDKMVCDAMTMGCKAANPECSADSDCAKDEICTGQLCTEKISCKLEDFEIQTLTESGGFSFDDEFKFYPSGSDLTDAGMTKFQYSCTEDPKCSDGIRSCADHLKQKIDDLDNCQ